jgi:hypothetical protein
MSPRKKLSTITAISDIVNESALRQARSGNRDSGTWSSPTALLLAGSLMRRFKKLEKRSPDMAPLAMSAPVLDPSPTRHAPIAVARTERKIPRMVFDAPNKGSPSRHLAPLSRGRENRLPMAFFASKGVPFASVSRNSNRMMTQSRSIFHLRLPMGVIASVLFSLHRIDKKVRSSQINGSEGETSCLKSKPIT